GHHFEKHEHSGDHHRCKWKNCRLPQYRTRQFANGSQTPKRAPTHEGAFPAHRNRCVRGCKTVSLLPRLAHHYRSRNCTRRHHQLLYKRDRYKRCFGSGYTHRFITNTGIERGKCGYANRGRFITAAGKTPFNGRRQSTDNRSTRQQTALYFLRRFADSDSVEILSDCSVPHHWFVSFHRLPALQHLPKSRAKPGLGRNGERNCASTGNSAELPDGVD